MTATISVILNLIQNQLDPVRQLADWVVVLSFAIWDLSLFIIFDFWLLNFDFWISYLKNSVI